MEAFRHWDVGWDRKGSRKVGIDDEIGLYEDWWSAAQRTGIRGGMLNCEDEVFKQHKVKLQVR